MTEQDLLNFRALNTKIYDEGRDYLAVQLKPILEDHNVKAISFTIYQVYHNDGDRCPTYINTDSPEVEQYNNTNGFMGKQEDIFLKKVADILCQVPDSIWEQWYDVDTRVIFDTERKFTEQSFYEHD